jgi:hypothetical protein
LSSQFWGKKNDFEQGAEENVCTEEEEVTEEWRKFHNVDFIIYILHQI